MYQRQVVSVYKNNLPVLSKGSSLQRQAQASQAKNTWCKGQFVYIENCIRKSPVMKKMCNKKIKDLKTALTKM